MTNSVDRHLKAVNAGSERFVVSAMRDLKLSQFRALGLLNEHGTVENAAKQAGEGYSSVKSQVMALNAWFETHLSVSLVTRHRGKQYELTVAGVAVAAFIPRLEQVVRDIVDASESPEVRVSIPCTSDCLANFAKVRDALKLTVEVAIHAVATSDFDPFDTAMPSRPVLSMGSMYCRRASLDLPEAIDYLILDEQKIVAITNDPGPWPEITTVPELLEMRPRILMPHGGVVWDFINEFAPSSTWTVANGTHMPVHDLHFGLRALSTRAEKRAVMLVHGVQGALLANDPRFPILEDLKVIEFSESSDTGPRAVTGLFYNRSAAARRVPKFADACEHFWITAQSALEHNGLIKGKEA